jgi:hypothetical protein
MLRSVILALAVRAAIVESEAARNIKWTDISFNSTSNAIGASKNTSSVYILTPSSLAKLDPLTASWVPEKATENWSFENVAVDAKGNPAYVGQDWTVHWKREGEWMTVECAYELGFGGDGSVYKISCRNDGFRVYK